jgi:hypothetical protein
MLCLRVQEQAGVEGRENPSQAPAGFELNDWLNQCQIFDDATGPHNNDLIFQGLTVNMGCKFKCGSIWETNNGEFA